MTKIETQFEGLYVLQTVRFMDNRGAFQKTFNKDFFRANDLDTDLCEIYYSVNNLGVIRGMHFQLPPDDHTKVVYVSKGRIMDVVVDLRKMSKTYKQHFSIELDSQKGQYLYIPKGFAHGFATLENGSIVNYAQTSCYTQVNDCGILFDSCGIEWPFDNPIVSERDLSFDKLTDFKSPF